LAQTQQTLRWLARQLQRNNTVELLIERIQPSWLETKWARQRYRLIYGLIYGLIFGLIFGLIGWPIVGLIFGLDNIQPVETFKISMSHEVRRDIVKILKSWLIFGLIDGLIVGLSAGLIVGLIYWLIAGLIAGLTRRLPRWLPGGLLRRLARGLAGGSANGRHGSAIQKRASFARKKSRVFCPRKSAHVGIRAESSNCRWADLRKGDSKILRSNDVIARR
jgi:predicted lipid-binding transport protein (Tim44 family)